MLLRELLCHLRTRPLGASSFQGSSTDLGWGRVFGGQVVAQGLDAAWQTIPDPRPVHSIQCSFLRPGSVCAPITYRVAAPLDGSTVAVRSVVAEQNGKTIALLNASFMVRAVDGQPDHQAVAPPAGVPPPEASVWAALAAGGMAASDPQLTMRRRCRCYTYSFGLNPPPLSRQ